MELQNLADGTKENYRDQLRLHVFPAFEHYLLSEVTTGRVEWVLRNHPFPFAQVNGRTPSSFGFFKIWWFSRHR